MPPADEYLDLVNEHDAVVGRRLRSEVYAEGLSNFRVVNAFVMDDQGRLLIPRRAADKRIFPLCLDMSMGGHVESGETYDEAFKREIAEELNIDADKNGYRVLGTMNPHEHGVSAFMKVYEVKVDKAPRHNPDDFSETFWLTPEEAMARIVAGDPCKDDLPRLIRRFYLAA